MIFVVENSLEASNCPAKVPASENRGGGFYDPRGGASVSQKRAVITPGRIGTFKSELNVAVGVDALLFELPSAFAGERPEVIPEEANALSGMFDARFLPRDTQPQVLV